MKIKQLLVFVLLMCSLSLKAQDGADGTKFHFGLRTYPSIAWMKPDAPGMSGEGAMLKFGYGVMFEYNLSDNIALATGLDISWLGGKLSYGNGTFYRIDRVTESTTDSTKMLFINQRNYNIRYVDLPVGIKMKTNQIGYMTYFGQFGLNLGFRYKARAEDMVTGAGNSNLTNKDVNIEKDINMMRVGLAIGLGAEYNFIGNTSLVVSLIYNNGFTNILKNKSKELRNINDINNFVTQKAVSNYVALSVGVLF